MTAREATSTHQRRRTTPAALAFLVALYVAWLSAVEAPFGEAFRGASAPSDLTRDFVAAEALARGEALSTLDGARGNAEAVRAGAAPVRIVEHSPFHLHPPPASLPMRLLVPLGYRGASMAWLGISILLLGVLARWLGSMAAPVGGRGSLTLFVLLIVWPPVLTNLQLGQWSIALAVLIAAGFRAWEDDRPQTGAALWGVAAALKVMPALLLAFVVPRHRRAALVFVGVVAAAILLALPLGGGLDAWMAFRRDSGINVEAWQTWWHNTVSLNGLLARLLVGGPFARPFVRAPGAARALLVVTSVSLVAAALWASRARDGGPRDRARDGCAFAAWNILVVVLNPLAWAHTAILLLLPAALVLRAADAPEAGLAKTTRRHLRAAVAVAIVILTIPKETTFLMARPLPVAPALAPLLSAHVFAALLLFAAAVHGATRRGSLRRRDPPDPTVVSSSRAANDPGSLHATPTRS